MNHHGKRYNEVFKEVIAEFYQMGSSTFESEVKLLTANKKW